MSREYTSWRDDQSRYPQCLTKMASKRVIKRHKELLYLEEVLYSQRRNEETRLSRQLKQLLEARIQPRAPADSL